MRLTEAEVEQVMACRKVVDESILWKCPKDHPDWSKSEVRVFHDEIGEMKMVLSVSRDGRKVNFAVIYRGARVRSLDLNGVHTQPDGTRFDRKTHKHTYTDRYGDSWAYLPDDITSNMPDEAFRQFCSECNIDFRGNWSPLPTQKDLEI